MSTPLADGLITQPWVAPGEFLASPTWLDSQDLVPGGNANQQLNSLNDVMLKASGWAETIAEQNLAAHVIYASDRFPVDNTGKLYLTPRQWPIRSLDAFAWGSDFSSMELVTLTSDQVWIERERGAIVKLFPMSGASLSTLQFGTPAPQGNSVFAQYAMTVGYCVTTLTQAAAQGATQIYVNDPTGLMPAQSMGLVGTIPGSTARIWEPLSTDGTTGGEEAVQVADNWVAGTNPVLLKSGLKNNHAVGAPIDELPPEVHGAVISLAIGLLCRDDVSKEAPFPGGYGPSVRESKSGGKAGGLVSHAMGILHKYKADVH